MYSVMHLFRLTQEEPGLATEVSQKAGAAGITLFTGNKIDKEYRIYLKSHVIYKKIEL